MDPDANIRELREIAEKVYGEQISASEAPYALDRMAELFTSLDEWIKHGGFLPNGWERKT